MFTTREDIRTKIESARKQRQESELKECTFAPTLNPKSLKIAEQSRRYSKTPSRVHKSSLLEVPLGSKTCPVSRASTSEIQDLNTVQRRLNLDSSMNRAPFMNREANNLNRVAHISGIDSTRSECTEQASDTVSFLEGNVKCKVNLTSSQTRREPKAWTINENGEHVLIQKSPSMDSGIKSGLGDPSKTLLSSLRKPCTLEERMAVQVKFSLALDTGSELSALESPACSTDSRAEVSGALLGQDEINEDTPISLMRDFVERKQLNVKANSKKALYRKICEALERRQCGGSDVESCADNQAAQNCDECASQNPAISICVQSESDHSDSDGELSVPNKEETICDGPEPHPPVDTTMTVAELELLDNALLEGSAVRAALTSRLGRIKGVRALWPSTSGAQPRTVGSSPSAAALQRATEADDCGVLADVLAAASVGSGAAVWLDLDAFALLLRPAGLPRLLAGGHVPHLLAALRALLPLIHRLGPLVAGTPRGNQGGVNVVLEERCRRCDAVADGLAAARVALASAAILHAGGPTAALARACDAAIRDVLEVRGGSSATAGAQ